MPFSFSRFEGSLLSPDIKCIVLQMKSAFDPSRDEYDMVKNETCSGDQLVSSDDDSSTSSEVMEINTQLSAPCSQPSQPSQPSQQAPEGKEQLEVAFEGEYSW